MQSRHLHLLLAFWSVSSASQVLAQNRCGITSIYQLGDSHTDTGNFIRLSGPASPYSFAARPPYGETLGNLTGRHSDGLLIVDYFAKALHLPLVNAYLAKDVSFENGVLFSVAGCTALSTLLLTEKGIVSPMIPNFPLKNQLFWFRRYPASICKSSAGQSIRRAMTNVPSVVRETVSAAREILSSGATKMVIFGDFPTGCFPSYLTILQTTNSTAYDEDGCLIEYNNFQIYRNNYLSQAITSLRTEFPYATIIYGDYYSAFKSVLKTAVSLGFNPNSTLKTCCGKGGAYNFDLTAICGTSNYEVCPNPNEYISWDGIHMTQRGYYHMAQYLIREILPQLSCPVNEPAN